MELALLLGNVSIAVALLIGMGALGTAIGLVYWVAVSSKARLVNQK